MVYNLQSRFRYAVPYLTPFLAVYHALFWIIVYLKYDVEDQCKDCKSEELGTVDKMFLLTNPSEGESMFYNLLLFGTYASLNYKQVVLVYAPIFLVSATIIDAIKRKNISEYLGQLDENESQYEIDYIKITVDSLAMRFSQVLFYLSLVKITYDNELELILNNKEQK